jgi:hypothetical protein
MRIYLLAALVLTLTGCASGGPRIEAAQLSQLQKGETTVTEVIKRFGRPSILSKNMDGTQTAAYLHAEDRSDVAAMVPLMGALAGKADADVDSVIFSFDTKGILRDYKTTESRRGTPVAVDAGKPMQGERATQAGSMQPEPPTQQEKKAAAPAPKPWTIQTWQPSRQVENR